MVKRIYKSARGATIDFDLMQTANKNVIAVGNASMNANGDVIGRGGKIIRKVEDIPVGQLTDSDAAYNQNNPKSTRIVSLKDQIDEFKDITVKTVLEETPKLDTDFEQLVKEPKKSQKTKRKIVDSEE